MSMVRNYFRDLNEFYAGDTGRFERMVGAGGKSFETTSPAGWARHIDLLALECIDFHADELRRIFDQLTVWGLTVDHSIFGETGEAGE